MAGLGLALG